MKVVKCTVYNIEKKVSLRAEDTHTQHNNVLKRWDDDGKKGFSFTATGVHTSHIQ